MPFEALLREILLGQRDGRCREIDAGHTASAFRKAREVHPGTAADFEHLFIPPALEVDEPQEVVEFFEMILIQIVEEATGADRMPRNLEVVNVPLPVRAHLVYGRHGR